jgi:hypothetical protein
MAVSDIPGSYFLLASLSSGAFASGGAFEASGAGVAAGGVVPAVPPPALSGEGGVAAAVEDGLSAELAGGVADILVSLRREHAATEPASATAIRATSKGFTELLARFVFIIKSPLNASRSFLASTF